jgi:predicted nucleic acid-binding protein
VRGWQLPREESKDPAVKNHRPCSDGIGLSPRAIAGNAPRYRWHSRQRWQRGICNLQNLKGAGEFESHSLRQLPRLWLGRCRFVCAARSRPAIAIYVLDTNPVSELMKGTEGFVERLASHAPSDITIPQPVVAQIAYGIERVAAFQASNRVAVSFRSDLLGDSDTAIAAHALAFDATLVTSNLDRMTRVPRLKVEHWTQ